MAKPLRVGDWRARVLLTRTWVDAVDRRIEIHSHHRLPKPKCRKTSRRKGHDTERIRVRAHGTPGLGDHLRKAWHLRPKFLKVETVSSQRTRGAIHHEGAMVGGRRRVAAKEATWVGRLPSRGAEHPVDAHQGGGLTLVGPGVAPAMKIHITQLEISHKTMKASDEAHVELGVVLICRGCDHVEVDANDPGPA